MIDANGGTIHAGIDSTEDTAHDLIDSSPLTRDQKDSLHRAGSSASAPARGAIDTAGSAIAVALDAADRAAGRVGVEYRNRPLPVLAIGAGLLALVGVIVAISNNRK